MLLWQALKFPAYQNMYDGIYYDRTLMSKYLQVYCEPWEAKKHPSNKVQLELECQNWPVTCSIRTLYRTRWINAKGGKHIMHLTCPWVVESIKLQGSHKKWIFQCAIMLTLISMSVFQQIHLLFIPKKYVQHMCQQWMWPSIATNMTYTQITQHAFRGKYVNIHATYEVAAINDVARINVHRWW